MAVSQFCVAYTPVQAANTANSGTVYGGYNSTHMPNANSRYGWTIAQELGNDGFFSTGESRDKRISIGVESNYADKKQGYDRFTGKTLDNTTGGVNASISVGSDTYKRQIKNVENGIDDYDAVNISQLKAVADRIDTIGSYNYKLTTTASEGELGGTSTVETIDNGEQVTFDAGKNIKLTQTNNVVSIATKDHLQAKSITISEGTNTTTLSPTGLNNGGHRITNVAPGIDNTDAVNVGQLKESNSYFDNRINILEGDVNNKFNGLTRDIHRVGANSAALSAIKPIQYDPMEPTQIMVGVGGYKGEHALAIGVAHYKNESTMFHLGSTIGGHDTMYNAGITWKIGHRDEEESTLDRYRLGPISSMYAVQDELSAVKAQNELQTKALFKQQEEIESLKHTVQELMNQLHKG